MAMGNMRSSLGFLGADLLGVDDGSAAGKGTGVHTKPARYVINQQQEYASNTQHSIYDDTGRGERTAYVKALLAQAKRVIAREQDKERGITSKSKRKNRESTFKSTGMNVMSTGGKFGQTGMSSAMRTGMSAFTEAG